LAWSPELQKLEGHTDSVNAVAFSPDGSLLASASGSLDPKHPHDNSVRLWNPTTGQEVQMLEGHTDMVNAVTFSPNGSLLASASMDKTVRL
jgi:WD40 repeat protein